MLASQGTLVQVLEMTEADQTFFIPRVPEDCVPSILRDFSAPVKLFYQQSSEDLALLMAYDTDPVMQWQAAQHLAASYILDRTETLRKCRAAELKALPPVYIHAVRSVLRREADNALKASQQEPTYMYRYLCIFVFVAERWLN